VSLTKEIVFNFQPCTASKRTKTNQRISVEETNEVIRANKLTFYYSSGLIPTPKLQQAIRL